MLKKGKEITCCTVGKISAQFLRQPLEVPWSGARKPYACNSMLWPHLGPPRNPPPGTFPLAVARALVEHSLDPASSTMSGTMKWRLETPPIVLHKQYLCWYYFPWLLFRQNRSSLHQSWKSWSLRLKANPSVSVSPSPLSLSHTRRNWGKGEEFLLQRLSKLRYGFSLSPSRTFCSRGCLGCLGEK